MVRGIAVFALLSSALPAMAGEMSASEARYFVTDKLFSYSCFDGTRGLARIHHDGSVDGSIQFRGTGRTQYGTMPAATLRVYGERVCASLPKSFIQPCFYLERTPAKTTLANRRIKTVFVTRRLSATLDAIRRDVSLTRLITSDSARPKFAQSLAFEA